MERVVEPVYRRVLQRTVMVQYQVHTAAVCTWYCTYSNCMHLVLYIQLLYALGTVL
jgi:hypothetical protein